jgi:coniferyl-aldehyde dehydrogenase
MAQSTQAPGPQPHEAESPRSAPRHALLLQSFERLRAGYRNEPTPSHEARQERLARLDRAVRRHQDDIVDAIQRDFGNRSRHETRIAEIYTTLTSIAYIRKHLKGWMRPSRRHVPLTLFPARASLLRQPLGVVGIISPWNYPFQLAVGPLAYALAAGNRVLVKPSEYTPATSSVLSRLCADTFEPDLVDVITGDADTGEAFAHLPFDHLLFTGSTAVGKRVMRAAAENLTPVTLELGGKSPVIVDEAYPVDRAAARIAAGKWFNAGQTCIAPDYVLVHESRVDSMVEELRACVARYYPTLEDNPDYTAIINERHTQRLLRLLEDARDRGARSVDLNPAGTPLGAASRKIAPTLLLDVTDAMAVMQEEIFGPVLPIVPYRTLGAAIEYVNERPRPLALYVFDTDRAHADRVLERTVSGGACVNETLLHFTVDDLPFGGVGPSGMGAYHGREGFDTFSHKKAVFHQARLNGASMLAPPFGERHDRLLDRLLGKKPRS